MALALDGSPLRRRNATSQTLSSLDPEVWGNESVKLWCSVQQTIPFELSLPKTVRMAILAMDGSAVTNSQPRLIIDLPKTCWRAGLTPENVEVWLADKAKAIVDIDVL